MVSTSSQEGTLVTVAVQKSDIEVRLTAGADADSIYKACYTKFGSRDGVLSTPDFSMVIPKKFPTVDAGVLRLARYYLLLGLPDCRLAAYNSVNTTCP